MKDSSFLYHSGWVRHFREIPSPRKRSYMRRFPDRFRKVERYLSLVRITTSVESVSRIIASYNPRIILVDVKLLRYIQPIGKEVVIVPEDRIVYRHHKVLMMLADNLANYFRLLGGEPRRFREEARRFEK